MAHVLPLVPQRSGAGGPHRSYLLGRGLMARHRLSYGRQGVTAAAGLAGGGGVLGQDAEARGATGWGKAGAAPAGAGGAAGEEADDDGEEGDNGGKGDEGADGGEAGGKGGATAK